MVKKWKRKPRRFGKVEEIDEVGFQTKISSKQNTHLVEMLITWVLW